MVQHMIMPIDIDKKEFSRDKRGYNSREVDEFLDLIVVDYEKVLNDNRAMAHKIKSLEKQLEEAQKSDSSMIETLETAIKLMADISASAERRAERMMRDAELEAENMLLEAKVSARKLNDEHSLLKDKVERLREKYRKMLTEEISRLDADEYDLLREIGVDDVNEENSATPEMSEKIEKAPTLVASNSEEKQETRTNTVTAPEISATEPSDDFFAQIQSMSSQEKPDAEDKHKATLSDLSESLKKIAEEPATINDTIILK